MSASTAAALRYNWASQQPINPLTPEESPTYTHTFTRENTPDRRTVAGRMCAAIREVTGDDDAPCREIVRHGHLTMIAGMGARDISADDGTVVTIRASH